MFFPSQGSSRYNFLFLSKFAPKKTFIFCSFKQEDHRRQSEEVKISYTFKVRSTELSTAQGGNYISINLFLNEKHASFGYKATLGDLITYKKS